jgi:hypothetical protein
VRVKLAIAAIIAVVAGFAAIRYSMLVHEASTPLARYYANGICTAHMPAHIPGATCNFYLQVPPNAVTWLNASIAGESYTFQVPYGGLIFNKLLTGRLRVGADTAIASLTSDGKVSALLEAESSRGGGETRGKCSWGRRILEYNATIGPGMGRAVELQGLQVTLYEAYVVLVEARGNCTLDVKLYAFQDRLAWEVMADINKSSQVNMLIIPLGGAVDETGVGPVYTKLILNDLRGGSCSVKVRILATPTARLVFGLAEGGRVAVALPLLCGGPAPAAP